MCYINICMHPASPNAGVQRQGASEALARAAIQIEVPGVLNECGTLGNSSTVAFGSFGDPSIVYPQSCWSKRD